MQSNGIPLVNVPMGPGSQDEGDMVLDYMQLPSEMDSYDIPILPEPEEAADCPHALAVFQQLQDKLKDYHVGDQPPQISLASLPDGDLDLVNQVLGEGEVSLTVTGATEVQVQETVLAGVWRLREVDNEGLTLNELIEVADVPTVSKAQAFRDSRPLVVEQLDIPEGVLNAPSVLVEIAEASAGYCAQTTAVLFEPHVINLSLLPFSPQDHAYLDQIVGLGPVKILSRGYGNCRITSACIQGLWRVQYFNSTDQLILDTLEVTDIPLVACAAPEDLSDSYERLIEIREVLV